MARETWSGRLLAIVGLMLLLTAACGESDLYTQTVLEVTLEGPALSGVTGVRLTLTPPGEAGDDKVYPTGGEDLQGARLVALLPDGFSGRLGVRAEALGAGSAVLAADEGAATIEPLKLTPITLTLVPAGVDGGPDGPGPDGPDGPPPDGDAGPDGPDLPGCESGLEVCGPSGAETCVDLAVGVEESPGRTLHCGQCNEICEAGTCQGGTCVCPESTSGCDPPPESGLTGVVCIPYGSNDACGGCGNFCDVASGLLCMVNGDPVDPNSFACGQAQSCGSDADCTAAGQICDPGLAVCVASEECPADGLTRCFGADFFQTCDGTRAPPAWSNTQACPAGHFCDEPTGVCVTPPLEICDDGIDNDGNDRIDCADDACDGQPCRRTDLAQPGPRSDGELCQSGRDCQSLYCPNGFCGPRPQETCQSSACTCVAATDCTSLGAVCGVFDDFCGSLLDCGTCNGGTGCDGRSCQPLCVDDSDCADPTRFCDPTKAVCVQCTSDSDCPGGGEVCFLAAGVCAVP